MRWITILILSLQAISAGVAQTINPFTSVDTLDELKWTDLSNAYRKNLMSFNRFSVVAVGSRNEHDVTGRVTAQELAQFFAADYARGFQRAFVRHNKKYASDSLIRGPSEAYFKLNDVHIPQEPGESPRSVGFNPFMLCLNGTPSMNNNTAKSIADITWYLDCFPSQVRAVDNLHIGRWFMTRNRITFDAKGERISDLERMVEVTVDESLGGMPVNVKHYLTWNRRNKTRLAFEITTTWMKQTDGRWIPRRCEGKEYSHLNEHLRITERVDCEFHWQFEQQVAEDVFVPSMEKGGRSLFNHLKDQESTAWLRRDDEGEQNARNQPTE